MCRFAAYVGTTPLPLSSLLYDAPYSLEEVAHSPRELLSGTVNTDGTGVAWWTDESTQPLRYVTTQPPWSDPNLPDLSRRLEGSTILAAVRSATPGMTFGPANVAPFVADGLAGVHNGWIGGFRGALGRTLLRQLSDERFARLDAMNDSLALFLLVSQEIEDEPAESVTEAVSNVLERVAKEVVAAGEQATLNVAFARAGEVVAARTSVGSAVNSLYVYEGVDGVLVVSEVLDDRDGWVNVPEHSLVTATPGNVAISRLEHEGGRR